MNPVSVPGGNFQEISLTMKKLIATLTSSPCRQKFKIADWMILQFVWLYQLSEFHWVDIYLGF
jgi:hypothetical protein